MQAKLDNLGKVVETDVLVLGGGVAGCLAAIGSREQGANVLVVDKGVIESCGSMGHGLGHYYVQLNEDENDTDEAVAKYAAKPPHGYSFRVAMETYAKLNYSMFKRMEALGWKFYKNPDGTYWRCISFGQPGAWGTWVMNGGETKRLLAKEVRRVGSNTVGHIQVTKILKNQGRVIGAVGFDYKNGEFYIFRAKAVVCTMGNRVARMQAHPSTNNPFNCLTPPYMTGSGTVLPYDAGAKVIGLDNLGSSRSTVAPKGFAQIGGAWYHPFGARYINAKGERYLEKAGVKGGEAGARDEVRMQAYREQIEGRGPIYVDARHISTNDYNCLRSALTTVGTLFIEYWEQRGVDLSKQPMEMEHGELWGGGMVLRNEQCELMPIGSGLFGSTVFHVSHAMCTGYKAGTEAAKDALKLKRLLEVNTTHVAEEKARVFAPLRREIGYTPRQFEDMIRQVMKFYAGFMRNETGMKTGLNSLGLLEEHVNEIKAENLHELLRAHEAMALLRYCQLELPACIERKESGRGQAYIRSDYPNLNPAWDNKFIVQWQEDGKAKMEVITTDSMVN